jgi:site-specific recombinase XerD
VSSINDVVLPPVAFRFLCTRRNNKAGAIVRQLHRWMKRSNLELPQLEPWHVDQLVERPFRTVLTHRTRYDYRGELLSYLEWLYAAGELAFDPNKLRRGRLSRRPVPELAEQFVATLAITLRPGTCRSYRFRLRRFSEWMSGQAIELPHLDRAQVVKWLTFLKARGLCPHSRCYAILQVRSYLRWLYDRGLLARPADLLLRPTDLPKCPKRLPRPISPEADRQLRARLAASRCRYQQGLLLMRNTGLRIGELVTLELDCLRTDLQANFFLKVPLGKLYNERLVPLDAPMVELVHKLQRTGRRNRRWLLQSPKGCQTVTQRYRRALREACEGIDINGPMTTHRLRHTYATSLLCGGMSLVGVMRLLGHNSYHTTLRYAAITQETIGREYFEALTNIETRYQQHIQTQSSPEPHPMRMLSDLARWIQNHIAHDPGHERAARLLTKRLKRIETELEPLVPPAEQASSPPAPREN